MQSAPQSLLIISHEIFPTVGFGQFVDRQPGVRTEIFLADIKIAGRLDKTENSTSGIVHDNYTQISAEFAEMHYLGAVCERHVAGDKHRRPFVLKRDAERRGIGAVYA